MKVEIIGPTKSVEPIRVGRFFETRGLFGVIIRDNGDRLDGLVMVAGEDAPIGQMRKIDPGSLIPPGSQIILTIE